MERQLNIFIIMLLFILTSCSTTSFESSYNTQLVGNTDDLSVLVKSFTKAAALQKFSAKKMSKGVFRIKTIVMGQQIEVDAKLYHNGISYKYVSSIGLEYDGYSIHKKYYTWLNKLTDETDRQLLLMIQT